MIRGTGPGTRVSRGATPASTSSRRPVAPWASAVLVDGAVVVQDGQMTTVDAHAIARDARERQRELAAALV